MIFAGPSKALGLKWPDKLVKCANVALSVRGAVLGTVRSGFGRLEQEHFLNDLAEDLGQAVGKGNARVEAAVFDGVDGLAGHSYPAAQLFLSEVLLLA